MKTRRAYLVEPGKFEIKEIDIKAKADEVLVKVEVCGLCNWELNHWKGILGEYPQSLGHEWGGQVVEIGKNVTDVQVGDYVTGLDQMTGLADYTTINHKRVKIDKNKVKPEQMTGEPLKCIVTVLNSINAKPGDVGVVLGCGPMGLWLIQGLAGNLLSEIIAIDIDDSKLKIAKKYGATRTINPSTENPEEVIAELSNGRMADFVVEGTGNPKVINSSVDYLKDSRGSLIIMSSYEEEASFDLRNIIAKGAKVIAAHPGYSKDQVEDLRRAAALLENGTFQMEDIITHSFKLDDIQNAFETLENKPEGYLKGVIVP